MTFRIDWLSCKSVAFDPIKFRDPTASVSVSGLSWFPQIECLKFVIDVSPISGAITKRTVLSKIASIFDPVGWLAPSIVTAKFLWSRYGY